MPKPTRQITAAPEVRYYGGLRPIVIGEEQFRAQEPEAMWSDNGAAMSLAEEFITNLSKAVSLYGAEQARDAAIEYGAGCFFDLAVIDGRIHVVADFSNNVAPLRAAVPLDELVQQAMMQAAQAGDATFSRHLSPPAQEQRVQERPVAMGTARPRLQTPVAPIAAGRLGSLR